MSSKARGFDISFFAPSPPRPSRVLIVILLENHNHNKEGGLKERGEGGNEKGKGSYAQSHAE